jgi:hypothetical protein
MRSLILSLTAVCCLASVAWAQDFEAAGKHFAAAQDAFGARRYKTAAAEFEAAYGITKDPVLLYNIAESWEKAGDGRQAVGNYRQYLRLQPNAQDKAEVLKRVRAIEAKHYRLVDQSSPEDKPPPSADTAAPPATTTTAPATGTAAPATGTTAPATGTTAPAKGNTPPTGAAAPPTGNTAPPPPGNATGTPESTAPATGALSPPTSPPSPPSAATPEAAQPGAPPSPAVAPAPVEAPPPPGLLDEGPASKLRVGAWIGVASTLALLTAGAIFGLAAQSRGDEITRNLSYVSMTGQPNKFDAATGDTLSQLKSDGQLYNGLAIGFFSASAASAVATVVLFVVDAKRPKPPKHALGLQPLVGRNAAGLGLGGRF